MHRSQEDDLLQLIIVTGSRDLSYILVHSLLFRIIPHIIIIIIIIIIVIIIISSSIRKNNSRTGRHSAVEVLHLGLVGSIHLFKSRHV